jgi:hypothetical protein
MTHLAALTRAVTVAVPLLSLAIGEPSVAAGAPRPSHTLPNPGEPLLARVRTDNDRIHEVLAYAIRHSGSFCDLLATLNLFERTVYVQEGQCGDGHHGCVQIMPTPGGRNLLVLVNPRLQRNAVVAQLAHELYHAMEIAREPDVVSAMTLRELYRRIGDRGCGHDSDECWETRAAQAFEKLVIRQVVGGGAQPEPMMSPDRKETSRVSARGR